jgi:hypothetical protein
MDHDPDMDPRDYQTTFHITQVYDGSRSLLYPIPQTGSAAQDERYARWFLYAVVARHNHLRNELAKEQTYLERLRDTVWDSVDDRPNYTGALYLMKAIHDHQIDAIDTTIYARIGEIRDRRDNLGPMVHMPGFPNYRLAFYLDYATSNYGLRYNTIFNTVAGPYPFIEILLRYIHTPRAMARLKEQAELPDDDSDPEFGPYMDALDGIHMRWRHDGRRVQRIEDPISAHDDFGNSVVTDSAGNMLGPRGEGRIVVDVNGSAYYEPGRREPWTGD